MNEEIKALVSSLVEARSRMEDDTDEGDAEPERVCPVDGTSFKRTP